jgi:hypothetical protein
MGRISAFPIIYYLRVGLALLGRHVTSAFYFILLFISYKSCFLNKKRLFCISDTKTIWIQHLQVHLRLQSSCHLKLLLWPEHCSKRQGGAKWTSLSKHYQEG